MGALISAKLKHSNHPGALHSQWFPHCSALAASMSGDFQIAALCSGQRTATSQSATSFRDFSVAPKHELSSSQSIGSEMCFPKGNSYSPRQEESSGELGKVTLALVLTAEGDHSDGSKYRVPTKALEPGHKHRGPVLSAARLL